MADAEALLYDEFRSHLARLLDRHADLLNTIDVARVKELGHRGAEAALAPLIWDEEVGERWDTTETAEFLAITRQALHERVKRGTLLGVPGRGMTWFPTWQFDLAHRQVRSAVWAVLAVFADMDRPLAPVEIASWARRARPELDNLSPAEWIAAERPEDAVATAARHSAARLAA
jgi:hypothetical protein